MTYTGLHATLMHRCAQPDMQARAPHTYTTHTHMRMHTMSYTVIKAVISKILLCPPEVMVLCVSPG